MLPAAQPLRACARTAAELNDVPSTRLKRLSKVGPLYPRDAARENDGRAGLLRYLGFIRISMWIQGYDLFAVRYDDLRPAKNDRLQVAYRKDRLSGCGKPQVQRPVN